MTWVITLISILGAILNAQKKIVGFWVWMLANTLWIVVDLQAGLPAQAALFAVYNGICIYGLLQWRKDKA